MYKCLISEGLALVDVFTIRLRPSQSLSITTDELMEESVSTELVSE